MPCLVYGKKCIAESEFPNDQQDTNYPKKCGLTALYWVQMGVIRFQKNPKNVQSWSVSVISTPIMVTCYTSHTLLLVLLPLLNIFHLPSMLLKVLMTYLLLSTFLTPWMTSQKFVFLLPVTDGQHSENNSMRWKNSARGLCFVSITSGLPCVNISLPREILAAADLFQFPRISSRV